jgi:ketosteroid isomerase-like protein
MGGRLARAYGPPMTTPTSTTDAVDVVRGGFESFGRGDLAAFGAMFAGDAAWNHRNPDRLGGVHAGRDAILAFIVESGRLTAGTLRAVPGAIMAGDDGHVAVLTRVSGTRPDGRAFEDDQVLVFAVEGERVRHVDQYIGDPPAVTAFWA